MSTHEVQTLRQELTDIRKKLQEYADTIVSLHGELRNLRDGICKSCKRKFQVPARLVSSRAAERAANSSFAVIPQCPAKPTNSIFSWHHLLKALGSDHIPSGSNLHIPEIPRLSISNTLPQSLPISSTTPYIHGNEIPPSSSKPLSTSSQAIAPETVPISPRWSARRDATANAGLEVTFVRAFIHGGRVQSIRFSANGKYLAVAAILLAEGDKTGMVFIYDVETGDKICELEEYASQYSSRKGPDINCMSFSPNGRYLVAGDDAHRVTVWNVPKKRIRNIFRGHGEPVESVDFSPNGRCVVSASWDNAVCIWNMRDGSARVFTDGAYSFWSARFSPNGQFVVAGNSDGNMRTWDIRTGQLVETWSAHEKGIKDVAFTPDGRGLVSGSYDHVVKCWDVSSLGTVSGPEPVAILRQTSSVYSVAVSPDARWIASGLFDKRAVIWDAHTAMRRYTLIGHKDTVSSVDFSPIGSYLGLGSHDGHVSIWRYIIPKCS